MTQKWKIVMYHYNHNDYKMILDEIGEEYDIEEPSDILAIITNYVNNLRHDACMYRWHNSTGDPWCWEYFCGGFNSDSTVYSMFPSEEIEKYFSKNY